MARVPTAVIAVILLVCTMDSIIIFIDDPRRPELGKRLVDAEQGLPGRVPRADTKLPPDGLVFLGRVDRGKTLGPARIVEADKAAGVGFEAPERFFLFCLGSRLSARLGHAEWHVWHLDALGLGLLSLHERLVINCQAAWQNANFTDVRRPRCLPRTSRGNRTGR